MATNEPGYEARTPEEIQQEIHETQQRLGHTLDQIQDRLKPRRLRDQVMNMFNDDGHGGSSMPDTVRDNALPLAMIGLGLGWLMWSTTSQDGHRTHTYRSGEPSRGRFDKAREWTSHQVDEARDRMQHAGESLRRRAEDMRHRVGERTQEMRERYSGHDSNVPAYRSAPSGTAAYGGTGEYHYRPAGAVGGSRTEQTRESAYAYGGGQARHYGDRMRGTARQYGSQARHYGQAASHRARESYQGLWHMVDEHPLLAGVVGFAVGAAVGAVFPASRYEDELMGDYSDAMWERGREYGEDYVDRASDVARHAAEAGYEAARDTGMEEAREQGLTGGGESQDRSTGGSTAGSTTGSTAGTTTGGR